MEMISAFSSSQVNLSMLTLDPSTAWTGAPQKDFPEYHKSLQARMTFDPLRSKRQTRGYNSMMISSIEPVWLEPKLVSGFLYVENKLGPCNVSLELEVYNSTLVSEKHKLELAHIAKKLLPNTSDLSKAKLPSNLFLNLQGPAKVYLWARVMAWKITGQISNRRKVHRKFINKVTSFNAIIPSILPSRYLDAVVGAIHICASRHIHLPLGKLEVLQRYYCSQTP
ncbi:hypothetical protein DSO57_1020098 [Entomophthora muscae]|uniref:Uncharacterized protein n=1 Tax=Entomophthora muscae TaxID=34485 RepID=A0ACC2U238_9FUNG|nr:hypothetical protein DSO57_1020098 [Entomophthora muscae]